MDSDALGLIALGTLASSEVYRDASIGTPPRPSSVVARSRGAGSRDVLRPGCYCYSKSGPFEQLLYGGFVSLMCSGMLGALEGFVQNAGPTNAYGFWMAAMSLVNWTASVILPLFALTQLAAMALLMGGVVSEIHPGST